jgi:single-stranded DNA-binding protein
MLNQVVIRGEVVVEPKYLTSKKGLPILNFRINAGDRKKKAKENYFTITCFGKLAQSASKLVGNGSDIVVIGRLKNYCWNDKTGTKRETYQIDAFALDYISLKKPLREIQREQNEPFELDEFEDTGEDEAPF